MKNIRKALIIVLILCAAAAFLTVSAWADGISIDFDKSTIYPGDTCTMYLWDALEAGANFDNFVLPDGVIFNGYTGLTENGHSYSLKITEGAHSGEIQVDDIAGEEVIHGSGRIEITQPVPRPSFSINSSSTSYMIGKSESILLSVVNKQNMDGYTVHWWCENSGAVGGLSSPTGDSVYAGYTAAGKSRISAYVEFGTETVWANNVIEITVTQAVIPTDVTLNYYSYELPNGQGITLQAAVSPETATSRRVVFVSSDDSIVECTDYGNNTAFIKRKSPVGNAIITAYVEGYPDVFAQCGVTLPNEGSKTVFISADEYYPRYGQTITVRARFNNTYDSDNTLTHWVYDKNILEMTYNDADSAKFKAIKNGSTRITAYARKDGEMYGVESNTIDVSVAGAAINHQITYGNYATFDGTNPLYFTTNELYSNFKGVTVDGYALTNGNQYYVSTKDGYILIAMNPAYLKLLSSANYHTIQIYSTVSGPATGYFRNYGVTQTIYGVKTGDDNNIALWVTLCVIGFTGAAAVVITKRKEIFGK